MTETPEELVALRKQIDNLDERIIELLGERFIATREVGKLKARLTLPPLDASREAQQQLRFTELAKLHNVDPALVEELFKTVIATVRHEHQQLQAE